MSFKSVKNQHADLNRTFEERYDEISRIETAVKESLIKVAHESAVSEESVAWALRSLDTRELLFHSPNADFINLFVLFKPPYSVFTGYEYGC